MGEIILLVFSLEKTEIIGIEMKATWDESVWESWK
jgi:hypothetical protein